MARMARRTVLFWGIGLLVGVLLTTAVRFAFVRDTSTHYHANFAVFINGQQQQFDSFAYYEEVAACSSHNMANPKIRVHMHDQNAGLVHVHDDGVTWGQFFANLGYSLGRQSIETENDLYVDGADGKKLSFILNGTEVNSPMNQVIQSEDKLLVSYGDESMADVRERVSAIPNDAAEANTKADPSACAGAHSMSFGERLKQAVGLPAGSH
ncbi:hypothetical protein E6P97_03405 [Patescibacteria group bacterium]|nr:MAG: hypothetical protein E6P97_03405 [Patescibacteria group bacterium]